MMQRLMRMGLMLNLQLRYDAEIDANGSDAEFAIAI